MPDINSTKITTDQIRRLPGARAGIRGWFAGGVRGGGVTQGPVGDRENPLASSWRSSTGTSILVMAGQSAHLKV
jgi:hypothetical protein